MSLYIQYAIHITNLKEIGFTESNIYSDTNGDQWRIKCWLEKDTVLLSVILLPHAEDIKATQKVNHSIFLAYLNALQLFVPPDIIHLIGEYALESLVYGGWGEWHRTVTLFFPHSNPTHSVLLCAKHLLGKPLVFDIGHLFDPLQSFFFVSPMSPTERSINVILRIHRRNEKQQLGHRLDECLLYCIKFAASHLLNSAMEPFFIRQQLHFITQITTPSNSNGDQTRRFPFLKHWIHTCLSNLSIPFSNMGKWILVACMRDVLMSSLECEITRSFIGLPKTFSHPSYWHAIELSVFHFMCGVVKNTMTECLPLQRIFGNRYGQHIGLLLTECITYPIEISYRYQMIYNAPSISLLISTIYTKGGLRAFYCGFAFVLFSKMARSEIVYLEKRVKIVLKKNRLQTRNVKWWKLPLIRCVLGVSSILMILPSLFSCRNEK
jgi:hypothetical protein